MPCDCRKIALRWALAPALLLAWSSGGRGSAIARAEAPSEGTVAFRLFLKDGTPVATLGECTRAGGRVIFTLPLGSASAPSSVQLVSLPDHVIDWERTARYTDAVRAKRYAETRGEAEFSALTLAVARALTEVAISAEPARRLSLAEEARRRLVEWPRTHYAYRADDVRELALVVDETIADIRADLGEQSFSIDLVAMTEAPSEPILPEPTLQESIAHAVAVARLSDVPSERVPLQQAILSVLDPKGTGLPTEWAKATRRNVESALKADQRKNLRYSELVRSALDDAASRASRADVEGIGRLVDEVRREDAKLGGERPGQMSALVATLEAYARQAQRRRLDQQVIALRLDEHAEYRRETSSIVRGLRQMEKDMSGIRGAVLPERKRLTEISAALQGYLVTLVALRAPAELSSAHENLLTSIRLMQEAARLCLQPGAAGNGEEIQNASAAAAGAQLLLSRARTEIANYFDISSNR